MAGSGLKRRNQCLLESRRASRRSWRSAAPAIRASISRSACRI